MSTTSLVALCVLVFALPSNVFCANETAVATQDVRTEITKIDMLINGPLDISTLPNLISALLTWVRLFVADPMALVTKVDAVALIISIVSKLIQVLPCAGDSDYLNDYLKTNIDAVLDQVATLVVNGVEPIFSRVRPIWNLLQAPLFALQLGAGAAGVVGTVGSGAGGVVGAVEKTAGGVVGALGNAAGGIVGTIGDGASQLLNGAAGLLGKLG